MSAPRALPDALLPAHRALARRVAEHSTTIAVLRAHDAGGARVTGRAGGGWEVVCACARRLPILPTTGAGVTASWQQTHAAHVVTVLAEHADDVMAELALTAWPDDPSPLEERAFAAGVAAGRSMMLDEILDALPPEGPFLADLIAPRPKEPTP